MCRGTQTRRARNWYARIKSRPSFRVLLERDAGRPAAVAKLRQSRFLTPDALKAALLERGACARLRCDRRDAAGCHPACRRTVARIPRRRRAWRHGVDGGQCRAPRRSARAVARRRARSSCSASITAPTTIRWRFCKQRTRGGISVYARGDDYHELIKPRLKKLGRWLIENAGGDIKVFVDTAPVMEKPLAAAAGLGWQGKHTNLVSRQFGSWLFLGAIFTTLDLPAGRAGSTIIAATAAPVSISARRRRFPRRIVSMRGAASPTSPSSIRVRSRASCGR